MTGAASTVVVIPLGGLGNQLFQYAAGLVCTGALGPDTVLWIGSPERNGHSQRDYWTWGIFPRAKHTTPCPDSAQPPKGPYLLLSPPGSFAPWAPPQQAPDAGPINLLLRDNYYQYYPAIVPAIAQVRADIHHLFEMSGEAERLAYKYQIVEPATAFLHVRRGDYLKFPTIHWLQSPVYLEEALDTLREKSPGLKRVLVLSDDSEWCRAHPLLSELDIVDEADELSALALMTLCHAGGILANSTFSWWGAMLGPSMVGAPVIYPRRWYGHETPDLFPPHWIPAGPPPPLPSTMASPAVADNIHL